MIFKQQMQLFQIKEELFREFVFTFNLYILQLWVGCGRHGELVTFDAETLRKKHSIFVETRGISKITQIQDKVLSAGKNKSF